MKAIVYEGINNVQVAQMSDPKLEKHDDIIIKVTSTAICGSDLHLVHGFVPNLIKGTPLGHETMGIVLEAGKDVTKVKPDNRVIIPFPVARGHCAFCESDCSVNAIAFHTLMWGLFKFQRSFRMNRHSFSLIYCLLLTGELPSVKLSRGIL